MSIHLNYYFLSIEGRKKFEEWRDKLGITDGKQFKVLECLYKKGPQMISQIATEMKLHQNDIIPEIEAFEQAKYIESYKP
jgi:DNA-binding MarR family transcriptional regulator